MHIRLTCFTFENQPKLNGLSPISCGLQVFYVNSILLSKFQFSIEEILFTDLHYFVHFHFQSFNFQLKKHSFPSSLSNDRSKRLHSKILIEMKNQNKRREQRTLWNFNEGKKFCCANSLTFGHDRSCWRVWLKEVLTMIGVADESYNGLRHSSFSMLEANLGSMTIFLSNPTTTMK